MLKLISQSYLDCGFIVASSVGMTYDWGEHNNIEGLLISHKYFQYLRSDKRYVDAMTGATMSLRMVL
jgi:hypothetical protein